MELRLIIVGFMRSLMVDFKGPEGLRQKILKDIEIAKNVLNDENNMYSKFKNDKFFVSNPKNVIYMKENENFEKKSKFSFNNNYSNKEIAKQ